MILRCSLFFIFTASLSIDSCFGQGLLSPPNSLTTPKDSEFLPPSEKERRDISDWIYFVENIYSGFNSYAFAVKHNVTSSARHDLETFSATQVTYLFSKNSKKVEESRRWLTTATLGEEIGMINGTDVLTIGTSHWIPTSAQVVRTDMPLEAEPEIAEGIIFGQKSLGWFDPIEAVFCPYAGSQSRACSSCFSSHSTASTIAGIASVRTRSGEELTVVRWDNDNQRPKIDIRAFVFFSKNGLPLIVRFEGVEFMTKSSYVPTLGMFGETKTAWKQYGKDTWLPFKIACEAAPSAKHPKYNPVESQMEAEISWLIDDQVPEELFLKENVGKLDIGRYLEPHAD